jgi:hypothetical protein
LIEQLALSKTKTANELKILIDGHKTSFLQDLEAMFSANVPPTEKARLSESAKLDYRTAVDAAKAKFEIAATDRVRAQEENKTEHAAAKLAALKKKDGKTLGAAVDTKIAVFGALLKEKNKELVVPVLDTTTQSHLLANADMQSRTGKSSLNGKGAGKDLQAGAAKTKQGAAKKGSSKKKISKKKKAAAAAAAAAAPAKTSLSKKELKQQRKQQQQQKKAPGSGSRSAAKGGSAGRKRKRAVA